MMNKTSLQLQKFKTVRMGAGSSAEPATAYVGLEYRQFHAQPVATTPQFRPISLYGGRLKIPSNVGTPKSTKSEGKPFHSEISSYFLGIEPELVLEKSSEHSRQSAMEQTQRM